MKSELSVILVAFAMSAVAAAGASAGGSTIGVTITSDRQASDFALPKDTKYELEVAHAFEGGAIIGGSVTYNNEAFSTVDNENLEGTFGFRARFNDVFAVTASAGIGEHFQAADEGGDFPYYVFRVAADLTLSRRITWTAVSYRFRNAFDTGYDYDTPQLATAIAYRFDKHSSVSAKLAGNWSEGEYSSTGISLGYKFGF
jgi:hypothetical protein